MADTDKQTSEQAAAPQDAGNIKFTVQRIFVKDLSFEAPSAPEIFRTPYKPKVSFNMNTKSNKFDENLYEVVLTMTAEVKDENDKPMYVAEVQQAGVFEIEGLEGERLTQALHITCPNVLFPYGRESIDSLANKGTFPSLMLAPVNFEAVYVQAKRQQEEQEKKAN
ncbi:MAG: protein-export chaperone SecB [Gammaproteobacteria bacterium]|nr:protein-export chaperone SecB [Gammaproteobacteria bacterium]MAY03715.1 protein-export chaperone SecB [Gammaproteobacteria bacterium]|tara:strand:+ start:395106 stop:395603 length:498 start_codon:yes stop_codon:yes gene_type:complete